MEAPKALPFNDRMSYIETIANLATFFNVEITRIEAFFRPYFSNLPQNGSIIFLETFGGPKFEDRIPERPFEIIGRDDTGCPVFRLTISFPAFKGEFCSIIKYTPQVRLLDVALSADDPRVIARKKMEELFKPKAA